MSDHKYEARAGALRVQELGDDHREIGIRLCFYIWDMTDRFVAYCSYSNEISDEDQKDYDETLIDADKAGKGRRSIASTPAA